MDNEYGKLIMYQEDDGGLQLDVKLCEDTVWLTQQQMAELFGSSRTNVVEHIGNIYDEGELDAVSTCRNFRQVRQEGHRTVNRQVPYYNLDMIVALGYRIKSKVATKFRIWATKVLHQYLIDGYAINNRRLEALNRTVEIQSKIIAGLAELDAEDVLKVIREYESSFVLLDEYDHQNVTKPALHEAVYILQGEDCRKVIREMCFYSAKGIFGTEKEQGKLDGILAALYQTAFGEEVYPSLEEKAANLLYFLIKDHPFNDGCKRIGAAMFLYFLGRNGFFVRNKVQNLSKSALAAITLMVAESGPEEKDIIIQVVINLLSNFDVR